MGFGETTSDAVASMMIKAGSAASIVRLVGAVQNYAWGSESLLPAFLGVEPDGQPQAELWLGAHPSLPSMIGEPGVALDAAVAADPSRFLGPNSAQVGNALPFLMKVMAVASPLSIQVHPSKDQAEAGFERENALGIAIDASNRNYRDANHKPEIICALSNFELLCGFVDNEEAQRRLLIIRHAAPQPALCEVIDRFLESAKTADDRRALLAGILSLQNDVVTEVVSAVRVASYERGLEHLGAIAERYPNDAGVLVAALMNYRVLTPGKAIFFEAGQTHAYLAGLGIELLANSDNVVRAGLTPKHIDIAELLRLCDPMPSSGEAVLAETKGAQTIWPANCRDFALAQIVLEPGSDFAVGSDRGPRVALCTSGRVILEDQATGFSIELRAGESSWVFPGVSLVTRTDTRTAGESSVFLATSPNLV